MNSNNLGKEVIRVELSSKEADDLRNAIISTMRQIDEDKNSPLKTYSNRLEILLEKFR